jgi:hypothetical protein
MGAHRSRRGLGAAYHHMSYSACPCRMCAPSTGKGKRDWKRLLHKSARAQAKRILRSEQD